MKIQCMTSRTVFNHQSKYVHSVIRQVWKTKCQDILEVESLKKDLIIGGDGRCDSPGHSAKYCTYTIMNLETNKIITAELVQVLLNYN